MERRVWKDLSDIYDKFINNTLLYQVKSRLDYWPKSREMVQKLKKKLTKT